MTPDSLHDIALDLIDADALPRDRAASDPEALAELQSSILAEGLRQPIEIYPIYGDDGSDRWALISGYRRLSVFRALGRDTIPAFLRQPADYSAALTAMVSENEMRAQISPWEKAALIHTCLRSQVYDTADAAIDALFPALSRQKRSRIRGHLMVVEMFDGLFSTPERLSVSRLDRLAAALRAGWEDILLSALPHHRSHSLDSQWQALAPVLAEALSPTQISPAPTDRGAPRRVRTIRPGLTVRRELTRTGWSLRFSGPEAKSPGFIDDILDEVERWFGQT